MPCSAQNGLDEPGHQPDQVQYFKGEIDRLKRDCQEPESYQVRNVVVCLRLDGMLCMVLCFWLDDRHEGSAAPTKDLLPLTFI